MAFEGGQYYVHDWACQEGNRGSIEVQIYASHPAGDTPPGTYVTAGTANLDSEPAVDQECHDANGGKHQFNIALPNQLLRTFQQKKLYAHGIALAGNVDNALLAGRETLLFRVPNGRPIRPRPIFPKGRELQPSTPRRNRASKLIFPMSRPGPSGTTKEPFILLRRITPLVRARYEAQLRDSLQIAA